MARTTIFSLAVLFSARAFAAYDEFHFSSNDTEFQCPKMGFGCEPPQVCAHDSLLDQYYCCGSGSADAICWDGSTGCTNGTPSSTEIGCSEGTNAFCCLKDKEQCTQRYNQINICWSTAANPIANLSSEKLNETFSSLSSAKPKASTWSLDVTALLATSTPASTSAIATPSVPADSSTASPSSSNSAAPASKGVSGGVIGGAVVGGLVGLALIGGGIFFLLRRGKGKKAKQAELDAQNNPYAHNGAYVGVAQAPPQEKYAHEVASEANPAAYPPVEMPVNQHAVEMEGSKPANGSQLHR